MKESMRALNNALVKLTRAIESDGVDPISGYTTDEILDWIEGNQPLGPEGEEWGLVVSAAKRRLGILN